MLSATLHRAYKLLSFYTLCLVLVSAIEKRANNGYDFVNPLIGSAAGGHVFAGATLPFGMAKAVADASEDNQGGFASDGGDITGFSHMHDDGTGGASSLGNFPIFPQASCGGDNDPTKCSFTQTSRATAYESGSVHARPGYFDITLQSGIRGEMTVSQHTALYRFTFPPKTTNPLILLDLVDLPMSRSLGEVYVNGNTGRIKASGTYNPSFGVGTYKSYVCADFKGAKVQEFGTFENGQVTTGQVSLNSNDGSAGGWVQFKNLTADEQILVRVGVSLISTSQACANAEEEIPGFGFNHTLSTAEAAWQEKLNVVSIDATGVSTDLQEAFWSGIYRSMISPQNYTGENPLWQSTEPYYDSYYCIWDSFRSIHQLITLLDPNSQTQMVRSLIDIYRHEGKLPDCRMSLCKGYTQGGSNADIVLADSYLKNISVGVDWATGYKAVVSDAEIEPDNWGVEGRGNLDSYHTLGYIPIDDDDFSGIGPFTRSVSRTLEYAYDDFCIAQMAQHLGSAADYTKYLGRSADWRKMFNANQTSSLPSGHNTGFAGFVQPRYKNGSWAYQDPTLCSPLNDFAGCYLNADGHETYEGSCWLYSFFVPQDMASLITTLGGPSSFVSRLNYLHESGLLYVGDEQAFLTVYQYHFAGRPGKSAARAHSYIPSQFNATVAGLPGNDDSGAMGSFQSLSMMGIFPNPGQNVYFITPPFFPSISLTNGATGKTATIKNVNFDSAYENIYIQSATLNGASYTKNWLDHSFFLDGGVLELTLGSEESATWGRGMADVPPSLGPGIPSSRR